MTNSSLRSNPLFGTTAIDVVGLRQYRRGTSPLPERSVLIEAILDACGEAEFDPAEVGGFVSYGDDHNEPVRLMSELGTRNLRWCSAVWGGGGRGIAGAFGLAAAAILTGQASAVAAEADPDIRAVILKGAGNQAFCAGADLHPLKILALRDEI